jgi:hypothetical protein
VFLMSRYALAGVGCAAAVALAACSAQDGGAADAAASSSATPSSSVAGAAATSSSQAFGSGAADKSDPGTDEGSGPTTAAAPAGAPASVFLTFAGYDGTAGVQGAGYVADRVERGGTCTLTATRNGRSAKVSGPASPDARTTVCGQLTIPADQVSSGSWKVVLSYASAEARGESAAMAVTVP